MPVANPKQFKAMLKAAQEGGYAYPAINCSSITTMNAALKAFADLKSDGIIQFSTGAGQFASGLNNTDATTGTIILAEAAHRLAEQYNILVALNTDHCQPEKQLVFSSRSSKKLQSVAPKVKTTSFKITCSTPQFFHWKKIWRFLVSI